MIDSADSSIMNYSLFIFSSLACRDYLVVLTVFLCCLVKWGRSAVDRAQQITPGEHGKRGRDKQANKDRVTEEAKQQRAQTQKALTGTGQECDGR